MGACFMFRSHCLLRIGRETRGLDLGAGNGRWANAALSRADHITAVDLLPEPRRLNRRATWVQADARAWLADLDAAAKFDFVVSFNLIHFLPREYVLSKFVPGIARHVAPGGWLALRTFYNKPDPEPEDNGYISLYEPEDLVAVLPANWQIERAYRDKDYANAQGEQINRNWFVTDVLATRPN